MSESSGQDDAVGRRSYAFLHLSDIHFGQEKGGSVFINREIKKDLVAYLRDIAAAREEAGQLPIDAILVTGDIAFAGKEDEYRDAAAWLADLADALGCDRTAVHVVPGNHDVDRNLISPGVHDMIDKIIAQGQSALDVYMKDKDDRERLYARFSAYRTFAAGYGCVLDREGGAAGTKDFSLTGGLGLRFIGLNSALVCRGRKEDKEPGELFVGDKQRALTRDDGVEQIILMHHPISWLADGEGVWNRIKNRARIFISGHEHSPDVMPEEVDGNGTVLRIASGAIVPPPGEEGYGYTFNIIDLALGENDQELQVRVQSHIWEDKTTDFRQDKERFEGGHETVQRLPCPRFARVKPAARRGVKVAESSRPRSMAAAEPKAGEVDMAIGPVGPSTAPDMLSFAELRLKYFHNLTALQRLGVLMDLKVLPSDWNGTTTPGFELAALEAVVDMGLTKELQNAITKFEGGAASGA